MPLLIWNKCDIGKETSPVLKMTMVRDPFLSEDFRWPRIVEVKHGRILQILKSVRGGTEADHRFARFHIICDIAGLFCWQFSVARKHYHKICSF